MTSSLYKELAEQELAAVIDTALHTKICASRLLTGGLFNTTYLVDTQNCGKVVLRAGPVNRHLLMPFEHRLMEAENLVYEACRKKKIPVSEVLAMDLSKTVIDRDYMIVRYIPSRPLNEVELPETDRTRIYEDIGKATAQMHTISAPRFGRIVDVNEGKGFEKWSDCMLDELGAWESIASECGLFNAGEREDVRALFTEAVPYLDEIHTPGLVHTDLWLGNVLMSTDTPRPEFAAIIDADRALWGDVDFEFSSIHWMLEEEAFWKGYGRKLSMDENSRIRRGIYHLLSRLWNGYVFLKEYNQPEQAEEERQLALAQMEELKELFAFAKGPNPMRKLPCGSRKEEL